MIIGGFQKFSLIDYPKKISAIVFTKGCNFKCHYCHNPELFDSKIESLKINEILDFLKKRQGKLDAVVITGGEPTLHAGLLSFIQKIKKLKYFIKLDTNGTNPDKLNELISMNLLDYIAMDIKAPLEKYSEVADVAVNTEKIKQSINIIKDSNVYHEFRTTIVEEQLCINDFEKIGELIKGSDYYLQKFVPSKTLNPEFMKKNSYSDVEFQDIKSLLSKYTSTCYIR